MIGRAGRRGLVENADGSVESGHVIFAGRMSFSRLKHLVLDPEDMFCGHADLNPTYVLKSLVVGLSNPETAERAISGIYQAMPILVKRSIPPLLTLISSLFFVCLFVSLEIVSVRLFLFSLFC